MIRKVLLGIGGTPFCQAAVRRAVEICQHHDATLTAVTTIDEERLRYVGAVPLGGGGAATMLREHRVSATRELLDQALEQVELICDEAGVTLSVHRSGRQPMA